MGSKEPPNTSLEINSEFSKVTRDNLGKLGEIRGNLGKLGLSCGSLPNLQKPRDTQLPRVVLSVPLKLFQ